MGDISANFDRSEFKCSCCDFATVDVKLIELLEGIRSWFGDSPVTINSGCRCEDYNKRIRGAKHSKHRLGIAADIVIHGVDPHEVYDVLDKHYPDEYGFGKYDSFCHADVRPNKARWKGIKRESKGDDNSWNTAKP